VLLSQRSRWSLAATKKLRLLRRLLRLLRRLTLLLRRLRRLAMPLLRRLLLPTPLLRLLLRPPTRRLRLLRLLRRADPTGSGMKARAGREPVCAGFRVSVA
jgi:hypothetical protein